MSRKEPKLRPSITWTDINLVCAAADFYIQHCVSTSQVTMDTVKLVQVKEYLESFKPVASTDTTIVSLLEKYGVKPDSLNTNNEIGAGDLVQVRASDVSPLANTELTDEEKFDILKLRKECTYSEDEKTFMLNTGTLIMMRRASGKPVNAGDL